MLRQLSIRIIAATLAASAACRAGLAADSAALPEVTVTAQHFQLEQRVARFVTQITALENGDGLPRWQKPVCPLVSGLSQPQGEFMLGRVSDIARAAGVPLAGEHCSPNLYILVTGAPQDLLRGMEKRNRAFTFGYDASFYPPSETPASVVDAFIKTARAVRVWYSSDERDAGGKPLGYCQSQMVLPKCTESGFGSHAACDPNRYYRCGAAVAGGSHVVFSTVWTFSRVFVIVDQAQVQGVTVGQLADYIAMSGFVKLRPDANLGDAPTILKLFSTAPGTVPPAMTDWDQAFLKSVYATEQRLKMQRDEITHTIVREIAH